MNLRRLLPGVFCIGRMPDSSESPNILLPATATWNYDFLLEQIDYCKFIYLYVMN